MDNLPQHEHITMTLKLDRNTPLIYVFEESGARKTLIEKINKAPAVHWCPASKENLIHSINDRRTGKWAFNSRFFNKWNDMQDGTLCLFGNSRSGCNYIGFTKNKIRLDVVEDNWPFRSPSGLPWILAYDVNIFPLSYDIYRNIYDNVLNIGCDTRGKKHSIQTQNVLRGRINNISRSRLAKTIIIPATI